MSRLENDSKPEDLHDKNNSSEAEERREDVKPPNTSRKKKGVTSAFSVATGEGSVYPEEEKSGAEGAKDHNADEIANP